MTDSEELQSCLKAFAQPVSWENIGNGSGIKGPRLEGVKRSGTLGDLTLDDLRKHILNILATLLPQLSEIYLQQFACTIPEPTIASCAAIATCSPFPQRLVDPRRPHAPGGLPPRRAWRRCP